MAAPKDRQGRGQLSSIDMLPEEAEPDVAWVATELRDGKRLQIDILAEFNARLADRGIASVSKSAFNRYSVRKAMQFRQLDAVHRLSNEVATTIGTGGADKLTVAVTEMLKLAAFQRLEAGDLDTKGIMELARAVQAAAGATKTSTEHRRRLEEEAKANALKVVDDVEGEVAKSERPVDAAEVLRLIRKAYGVEE